MGKNNRIAIVNPNSPPEFLVQMGTKVEGRVYSSKLIENGQAAIIDPAMLVLEEVKSGRKFRLHLPIKGAKQ